mmetsp:Transcript_24429/g.51847  ORF Transcript_24429/g.51847 Transcript_24429/m.51847 type:complete len:223 (+) Transcript_24429:185-853(+)
MASFSSRRRQKRQSTLSPSPPLSKEAPHFKEVRTLSNNTAIDIQAGIETRIIEAKIETRTQRGTRRTHDDPLPGETTRGAIITVTPPPTTTTTATSSFTPRTTSSSTCAMPTRTSTRTPSSTTTDGSTPSSGSTSPTSTTWTRTTSPRRCCRSCRSNSVAAGWKSRSCPKSTIGARIASRGTPPRTRWRRRAPIRVRSAIPIRGGTRGSISMPPMPSGIACA